MPGQRVPERPGSADTDHTTRRPPPQHPAGAGLADRTGRRWALTIAGYALTIACVPLLAIPGAATLLGFDTQTVIMTVASP